MPIIDPEERRLYQREWLKRRRSGLIDGRVKYDWEEIQKCYDTGISGRQCRSLFGICAATWQKAVSRKQIILREKSVVGFDSLKTRKAVKKRLLDNNELDYVCSICGISNWMGLNLSLVLDHINGVNDDHRKGNLRLLCPNCNSQTDTFCGRNKRLKRLGGPQ